MQVLRGIAASSAKGNIVAIAERETHIEPNGVPDDRGRKLVAGKRDRSHLTRQTATRYRCRDRAVACSHVLVFFSAVRLLTASALC